MRSAKRLARRKSGESLGVKAWMRQWLFPPALWNTARRVVPRNRIRNRALSPAKRPTQLREILFPWPKNPSPYWVDVKRIVNVPGQSFTGEQHHFVRYLESGLEDLREFYRSHQPQTAIQARFLDEILPTPSGAVVLDVPWQDVPLNASDTPQRRPTFYGPVSDLEAAAEGARLDALLQSIVKFGFFEGYYSQPGARITGQVFVREDGDFRFRIEHGNHRTAVLAHLGWDLIPVHHHAGFHPVRLSDIARWPGVVDGRFAKETAHAMFEAFFRPRHQQLLPGW